MRNYDQELQDNTRQYAYDFDLDVMHPYMIKSFIPFMKKGNVLELGCYQGDFTKRLSDIFSEITCIEASGEAISVAKTKVNANFVHSTFEECEITEEFDNIFLTHVLEHIDNRVEFLNKINSTWLKNDGVLFVACPNANAPSRQIAVKMGLIEKNESVTEAEKKHGHRITYTLDTLESDIKKSGLKVLHKSGIFFKPLANFQWDELLKTDIISKEYLDGCYDLGHKYPDLCSSIYCVCGKR